MKTGNLDEKTIFENFKRGWEDGSLTDNDPIIKMVRSFSKVARKFGWEDWTPDIENDILIKIYKCGYSGEGSLEGYIRLSIKNAVIGLFHKEHQDKRSEMPTEVRVEADFDKSIEEEESSDRVRMIVSRTPEHLLWFIEAVQGAETYMSERALAKQCKKKRNQIVKAKKELQTILKDMDKGPVPSKMPVTPVIWNQPILKDTEDEPRDKSQTAKFKN
jgi:hypothetical protein